MPETITEWQRQQYESNVTLVHQQMEPIFTKYFGAEGENIKNGIQGAKVTFPIVGSGVARDKSERYEETQWGELEKSVRWCIPYLSYLALPLDNFDQVRSAISNINSIHTRGIAAALRRKQDLRGIAASIGSATQGEGAGTSVALPSNNQIALGSSPNDVLTLDKIKTVSLLFDEEGFPSGPGDRHWFYAPGQKPAILSITQAASSDFTARRIYDRGDIDGEEWMGFMWHRLADVRNQGASGLTTKHVMLPLSGTTRTNIAYCKGAMGLAFAENLVGKLDQLPTKTYTWQAYGSIDVDSVRILDGGVASILCLEQ